MEIVNRQPVFYVTHGGGPCFWITFPEPFGPTAFEKLKASLAGMVRTLPQPPRAIILVSAHWERPVVTVSTAPTPTMLYDYYGFPPHTYQLKYPAPGSPELAVEICAMLCEAGIPVDTDAVRGFDHGVFVPMLIIDPQASIPVVMVSLQTDLNAAYHLAVGAALAPLREQGVLIIGSGSSFHNMRTIFDGQDRGSLEFDSWLRATVTNSDPATRWAKLAQWESAPSALTSHPRAEHLIPLMVTVGAAGNDTGRTAFHDTIGGKAYSSYSFGDLTESAPAIPV